MKREEFEQQIGAILRDHGAGTTADLTDELVAYWNGHGVAYMSVHETASGMSYEDVAMDDAYWARWRSWFEAWIETPMFSVRPEVRHWLSEEPPADADS
jgi:hypothetical protein